MLKMVRMILMRIRVLKEWYTANDKAVADRDFLLCLGFG